MQGTDREYPRQGWNIPRRIVFMDRGAVGGYGLAYRLVGTSRSVYCDMCAGGTYQLVRMMKSEEKETVLRRDGGVH